ncbi:hypothetical protein CDD83_9917 [Cordyceps sp. RAO-2017]|nr:hypothetical protein CDD83_9917 [Cordyceps sp. RAO-2017]
MHHEQSYVFVNLGLGRNTSNFNVSLTPQFWNATGKGTLCVEKLPVPPGIENGTLASLQVVTAGAGGAALYNCADVRFVQGAKARGGCSDSQVRYVPVGQQKEGACPAGQGSGSPAGQRSGSGSARLAFDTLALAALVALAPLFVTGTGFL